MNNEVESKRISVKDLTTNHKVQTITGEYVRIVSITNGLYINSKLINYDNGSWSCLPNTDKLKAILIETESK